jgi:hypothetical protein
VPFVTLEKRKGEAAHNEIYYVQARSATKLKSQAMELGNRSATIGEKRGYPISAISEVNENLSRLYFPRARDRFRDMALEGLLVVVVVLVANICS